MVQPRLLRQHEAAEYFSMSVPTFKKVIGSEVTPIHGLLDVDGGRKICKCILYDKDDLDRWLDQHKAKQIAPETVKSDHMDGDKRPSMKGNEVWAANSQALSAEKASGTSTSSIGGNEFARALSIARGLKRNAS